MKRFDIFCGIQKEGPDIEPSRKQSIYCEFEGCSAPAAQSTTDRVRLIHRKGLESLHTNK